MIISAIITIAGRRIMLELLDEAKKNGKITTKPP